MSLIQDIQNSFKRKRQRSLKKDYDDEIARIKSLPRYQVGRTSIFDKPFKFHDNLSFLNTYEELFIHEIYRFNPSVNTDGIIIDCGANMGLSVLFFALNYPDLKIIAFEPDSFLFDILKENVKSFGLTNAELINKAVWTAESELDFYTDGGMGGRVNQQYEAQKPVKVQAVALKAILMKNKIEFLKIDIEGAETEVIKACADQLKNVNHLFFEYHNVVNKEQSLHLLLNIVTMEGFTYYIKESGVREKPFIDKPLICESFDMALNVFCYKTSSFKTES